MRSLWQKIKAIKNWVLILLGIILILFSVFNLYKTNLAAKREKGVIITPVYDQEGFAPIFLSDEEVNYESEEYLKAPQYIPDKLVIEKINLDAPIEIAEPVAVNLDGRDVIQFLVPEEFAIGWHARSAPLGVPGNTVLSGHHNAYGEVFKNLIDLEVEDKITLYSGSNRFNYVIADKMILPDKDQPVEVRLENGRWILPTKDERITLVTCWPARSNSHRLILIAVPDKTPETTATPPASDRIIQLTTPVIKHLTAATDTPDSLWTVLTAVPSLITATPTP